MRKHYGSTIAIIFGVLIFIIGATKINDYLISGPIVIIGAIAYRSAKKRLYYGVKNSKARIVLEIISILVIVAVIVLQKDLLTHIETDPISNFIIPIWAIIAYFGIITSNLPGKLKKNNKSNLIH